MAGIGFELKKLFREQGLLNNAKAYAYSSVTTIGPMILCMLMIVFLQLLMSSSGVAFLERELFLATVVYSFIFSVLITGGLSMILTRFIADMMYVEKYEHLLSSYYGAMAVCLPLGTLCAWLFLRDIPAGFGYKLSAYFLFSELIIIWIQAVHLSALKDFKRIVRNFFYGIVITVLGSWLVLFYTPFQGSTAVLTMMDAGFMVVVILTSHHFEQMFPPKLSRLYFDFLSYFRKYPALFLIGTFLYMGTYIHSFVYWIGPQSARVAEKYAISSFYDLPVFYAYLTVIPTLVTFVVSLETSFYQKFRDYYDKILNGGTLLDITGAKKEMQRTLVQEISFIMEVQLLFTVVSLALGMKLLPIIGMSMEQLNTFMILVLGYFLFIIAFIVMLIMLYYDDRKGVLIISSLFVVMNASLTYWTMYAGYHGLGMFIASLLTLAFALARLLMFVRNIDYYTFCAQPITIRRKVPFWQRWWGKSSTTTLLVLGMAFILSACTDEKASQAVNDNMPAVTAPVIPEGLVEDKRLYERDDDTSVVPMYLTILEDKPDQGEPLTWYALNRIKDRMEEGDLKVVIQEGAPDGSGPKSGMFGYGTKEANAKVSLRGNSTRYASQRSYKIRLNEQAGLWHDQRILNLNKHPFDTTRVRNKLSFDIFETLPDIVSLRTQFVHLYVMDLSEGGSVSKPYEDYGLYTHIEQPNERFLKNHWLDPYGQLYKAVNFEFFRYPDELKSQSDPNYNKQAFETHLEINGREEHDKLLAMLDDVNNMTIPIDEVFAKHFDLDNYLTWLAANILMDNTDTMVHNFFLYSPLNSNKWFFLPWDYDGGWEYDNVWKLQQLGNVNTYSSGISNYWGSVLHNRFFRSEEHVRLLKDKVDELYGLINNETIAKRLELYRNIIEPYIMRTPDINYLPMPVNQLDEEFKHIAGVPLRTLERFNQDLENPKPFFLGELIRENGKQTFVWDPSFDLQGDDLVYDWMLSKDPAFTQIVEQRKNLKQTQVLLNILKPGIYYWKVIARDENNNEQIAFDTYDDTEDTHYYGVREVKVE